MLVAERKGLGFLKWLVGLLAHLGHCVGAGPVEPVDGAAHAELRHGGQCDVATVASRLGS